MIWDYRKLHLDSTAIFRGWETFEKVQKPVNNATFFQSFLSGLVESAQILQNWSSSQKS